MSLASGRFRVYGRLSLVLALVLAVGLVLFQNRANTVSFWFFGLIDETRRINVLWIILSTVAATRIFFWVIAVGRGLRRDLRGVDRSTAGEAGTTKEQGK